MDGFWKNNPCVPRWTETLQAWWSGAPPRLLHPSWNCTERSLAECELRRATGKDSRGIQEFWNRFYSTSTQYHCTIPIHHIEHHIEKGLWEVWIVVHIQRQEILGTGVRRWLQDLHIGQAVWKRGAMIDYFCVHPAWRGRGVGRWILSRLQNAGPRPLPPHLILWEGLHPSIPPVSTGFFWWKKKEAGVGTGLQRVPFTQESWSQIVKGDIWSAPLQGQTPREVSLWCGSTGEVVAVWNTFHYTVEGSCIGILLGKPSQRVAEEMVHRGPFGVILSPRFLEGWSVDSPYQWIGYNMIWGVVGKAEFPCLAL